ncbi:MAG: hypothetical protein IH901_01540 [Proteobacteria bacterium]|nr:hypothetical protein [Pseudomonadota bacterium]
MKKILITALLFFWPLPAYGETSAEIKYYPAHYDDLLEMHFSESYSLALGTDVTNSTRAPAIKLDLQCTSQDQDYYGGIGLEVWTLKDLPVETVFGMFGPYEGEYHPARVTGPNLDISPLFEWIYYRPDNASDPWPLDGNLNHDPATLARISNALAGGWLRIEAFGFVYDFDLLTVRSTIAGFHQKCATVHGG